MASTGTCGRDNDPNEFPKVAGGYSYILAPEGLRAGDIVRSYRAGIPAGVVEGYEGSSPSTSASSSSSSTDPSSPQTVLPPSTGASTVSSSRALGMLRTLTLKPGNVLPLHLCPPGTIIHNISLSPSGKMQLCRSAGSFGQVVAHHIGLGKKDDPHTTSGRTAESSNLAIEGIVEKGASEGALLEELGAESAAKDPSTHGRGWALIKLQSGEVRRLHPDCVATVGQVSK
jgi:ribosomal protein L2